MKKHLIRIGQLPKILGISTSTLYRWIENGLFIPPIRLGGRSAVILESELDYFITETASGRQSIDVVKDIVKARTNKSSLA